MASNQASTASFVVSGSFNATQLLSQVNSALTQMESMVTARLGKMGTAMSTTLGARAAGGLAAAGATTGVPTPKTSSSTASNTGKIAANTAKTRDNMTVIKADLFIAMKRVLLWGVASRLVFDTFQKVKDSLSDIVQLNKTLVNIQKIRPAGFGTFRIEESILANAKRFGVAFQDIAETQRTFFQQGFTTNQVLKLTEAQLLGVTAANLTANESIELLIGTMSIFGIAAEKAITIIDKLQYVQANFAITTQDLAAAIRRVGPVVEQLGGSMDHLIGIITALKEQTRKSGEFIGTALTTVFTRLTTNVGASAVENLGIAINKTATELRPLDDILNDVAAKWKTLTDQERVSLAFALGARRRYAQVVALFNTYDKALEASSVSSKAFGASLLAQQVEVTSLARQLSILTETSRQTFMNIIGALAGGDAEGATSKLTQRVIELVDSFSRNRGQIASTIRTIGFILKWGTLATIVYSLGRRMFWLGDIFLRLKKTWKSNTVLIKNNTRQTLINSVVRGKSAGLTRKQTNQLIANTKVLSTATLYNKAYSSAARGAALSVNLFATALKSLLGPLFLIGGVFAAEALFSKWIVPKDIDNTKKLAEETRKLQTVFNLNKLAIDANREVLTDYFNLAKQFQTVGGVDVYKKVLRALEESGGDINKIKPEDVVADPSEFKSSAKLTAQAMENILNVLGFIDKGGRGEGKILAGYIGSFESFTSEVDNILSSLTRLRGGDFVTGEVLYNDLFGTSVKDVKKIFEEELGKIEFSWGRKTKGSVTDILTEDEARLLAANLTQRFSSLDESVFAGLVQEGKESGRAIGESMVIEVLRSIELLRFKGGDISFGESTILKLNEEDINVTAMTISLEKAIEEGLASLPQRMNEQLQRQSSLFGGGMIASLVETSDNAETLRGKVVETGLALNKLAEEFQSPELAEFSVRLKELETRWKKNEYGVLYLAKRLSSFNKKIRDQVSSFKVFSTELDKAQVKSLLLGKSLAGVRDSLLSGRIQTTSGLLVQLRQYKVLLDENIEKQRQLGIEEERISHQPDSALQKSDVVERLTRVRKEYRALVAETANYKEREKDLLAQLRVLLPLYNHEQEVLRGINKEYEAAKNSIKNYETGVLSLSNVVIKNLQDQININKELVKVKTSNVGALLQSEVLSIKKIYAVKLAELNLRTSLKKESIEGLRLAEKEKSIREDGLNVVDEATKKAFLGYKSINHTLEEAGDNLDNQSKSQQDLLGFEEKRLKLQEQMETNLANQNAVLNVIKSNYTDINQLAESYASVISDVVKNTSELLEGGFVLGEEFLKPLAQAFRNTVSDQFKSSLTDAFRGLSANQLQLNTEKLEEQLAQLQSKQIATDHAEITRHAIIDGCYTGAEYIYKRIRDALGTYSGAGISRTISFGGGSDAHFGGMFAAIAQSRQLQVEADLKSAEATKKLTVAMNSLGLVLGTVIGGGGQGAGIGASLGTAAAGQWLGTALGAFAGPIGGIVGGIFGGLFDKKDKVKEKAQKYTIQGNNDALRENTEAIIRNTQSFDFMRRLINAPTNFQLPVYAGLGGGQPSVQINFNGNVSGQDVVEDAVYNGLSRAYSNDGRRLGRR